MSHALPNEMTIYTLASVHQECLAWLKKIPKSRKRAASEPWSVDASSVAEVDAAGVQLLVALAHSLQSKRRSLHLDNPSAALTAACEGLGLNLLITGHGAEQ